jgi:hypothetical protein
MHYRRDKKVVGVFVRFSLPLQYYHRDNNISIERGGIFHKSKNSIVKNE